jgi:hypothetical protein
VHIHPKNAFAMSLALLRAHFAEARTSKAVLNEWRTMALNILYGLLPPPASEAVCDHSTDRLGRAACRHNQDWCSLKTAQVADVPPQVLNGTVPCALQRWCKLDKLQVYSRVTASAQGRLHGCLSNRRIVVMGDSATNELVMELMLLLGHRQKGFLRKFLAVEYNVPRTGTSTIVDGPLRREMWPNERNTTFRDASINFSLSFRWGAHTDLAGIRGGIDTVVSPTPAFQAELLRHGLHKNASRDTRPHVLVFGNTWHDYGRFMSTCTGARGSCECAPAEGVASTRWPDLVARYKERCHRVARWLVGVQRAGTQVVVLSLYPRLVPSNLKGRPPIDLMAATADMTLHTSLHASGFFAAGGRALDQWPVYAAYQGAQARGHAEYGIRLHRQRAAIHTSSLSLMSLLKSPQDRIEADLVNVRLQLLLNELCSPHEDRQLCGTNSFHEQGAAAARQPAECACPDTNEALMEQSLGAEVGELLFFSAIAGCLCPPSAIAGCLCPPEAASEGQITRGRGLVAMCVICAGCCFLPMSGWIACDRRMAGPR